MRNIRIWGILLAACLMLAACSNQENQPKGDVIVSQAKLGNFEQNLVNFLADHTFTFKLTANRKDIKQITVKVDEYHNGKYTRTIIEGSAWAEPSKDKPPNKLVISRQIINETTHKWLIGNFSDAIATMEEMDKEPVKVPHATIATAYPDMPLGINKDEEKIIASMVMTKKNGISAEALEGAAKDIKKTAAFDVAYVIKMKVE